VAGELETFLASHQAQDRTIPKFVEDEFRSFLECGILAHGFVRVRCESCGHSRLVPFSSRRRGAEREPDSLAQVLYLRAYRAGEEPPEDAWMLDWTDWAGAYEIMLRRRQEYQELTVSRWRDPVWLAWLAVPMLMVHMFEEYGFDVLGRTYDFPDGICRNLGYEPYPGCPIPPAHYPLVNLGVAWVGPPVAALLARRNLVIGLSWYGLLIFNGTVHVVATIATGAAGAGGVLTGGLFFIPAFCWVIYAVMKSGAMSGKALAVSVSAGIIAHVLLIAAMGLQKAGLYGATGVLVFDLIVIASAPVIGWVGSKFLGPVALKPLSAA